jgi:HAE1 family hydrophobic/amphiphilic exporter-1
MKLFYRTAFFALVLSLSTGLCDLSSAQAQTLESAPPPPSPQLARITNASPDEKSSEKTEKKPENPVEINNVNVLHRVGVQSGDTLTLTLNEAIRLALENNNSIEIARADVRFQETQLRSILGIYDPVFNVSPTLSRNSSTGSRATNDFRVNSDMTKFITRGGGNYRVFFDNVRTENSFSQSQLTSGNTGTGAGGGALYSSNFGVAYNQPLLRDFRIDDTRRRIKVQRRTLQQTDIEFRRQTIDVISQVQRAYWDLVFALRDQQNRVLNLNLSRENLRQVDARIKAGIAAPIESAEVATELANREGEVLLAAQQVSTAENTLKTLLLRDPTSAEWTRSLVPTDTPVYSDEAIVLEDAVKDAVENRPELQRLKLQREINAIDIDFFKNQTKPQIDLNTTVSLSGISQGISNNRDFLVPQFTGNDEILRRNLNVLLGNANLPTIQNPNILVPAAPSFLVGGFNRSFLNLFRSDAPNYTVGVTISLPLRNRTAQANLAGARVQQERISAQTRSQEQIVIAEVRNAVQAVETSRQRVLVARRARANAEIQLEGERKKYEVGLSTTFLLFQRENALANARNSEIRSETDYNKALADLQRVTSTTFRANNIEVDSPMDDK